MGDVNEFAAHVEGHPRLVSCATAPRGAGQSAATGADAAQTARTTRTTSSITELGTVRRAVVIHRLR